MSSQGVRSGKKASSDPGLCPIKGQLSVPCRQARARNQFSSLSLNTTGTTPSCQMLVIHPALNLIFNILPRDPQGTAQVLQTSEQNRSLRDCRLFYFLLPQCVQGPNRALQCAGFRYHSTSFDTVVQIETLFWQLEVLSEPSAYQSK